MALGPELASPVPASEAPSAAAHARSHLETAWVVLAILLYLLLVDAAAETWLRHSPVRLLVTGVVGIYLLLNLAAWRFVRQMWQRWSWLNQASASLIVLLAVLGVTAWFPGGLKQGLSLLGQPTSTVLALVSAAAVAISGIVLVRFRKMPLAGKAIGGLLAAYGVVAFLFAVTAGTPYADLFHGASQWSRLPSWLQGATVGGIFVVPLALVASVLTAVTRATKVSTASLHAAALSLCLIIVLAGMHVSVNTASSSNAELAHAGSGAGDRPEKLVPLPGVHVAPTPQSVNLVSLEMGGHVDRAGPDQDRWPSALSLITPDGNLWQIPRAPQEIVEIVLSFFAHQPALVSAVVIDPVATGDDAAKDVEIWFSTQASASGFEKVAQATLRNQPGDETITLAPTEARYVKIRFLSDYYSGVGQEFLELGKVKILEGTAAGYVPMLQRNPDLAALVSGAPLDTIFPPSVAATAQPPSPPAAEAVCAPTSVSETPVSATTAVRPGSRNVLVIQTSNDTPDYPPLQYVKDASGFNMKADNPDLSLLKSINFQVVEPPHAKAARLLPAEGLDTVVLDRACDIKDNMSDQFKRALVAWVAQGHKLIIQDSDVCSPGPDYGFLPYLFSTNNPGGNHARGDSLTFVEENNIANGRQGDPGFLDVSSWIQENGQQLGDSNLITQFDAHWCGHLFSANVKLANGFVEAYAHHGRGLIIYDGFDSDNNDLPEYQRIVTRELTQPVDPDGLPCSSRLNDFLITTDETLKSQPVAPGKVYTYPLSLLSNQGYKGTVKLSATSTPPDSTLAFHFDSDSIDLAGMAKTNLAVTTTAQTPAIPRALAVRGTDIGGKANTLCLQWTEAPPTAGSLKEALDKNGHVALYINFDFNKATIRPDGKQIIAQVMKLMKDNPELRLSIEGHTDSVGLHDYNVKLSQRRAAAVVSALVARGISHNRVSSSGFGPDSPIADNNTPEGRAKNRRVELVKM